MDNITRVYWLPTNIERNNLMEILRKMESFFELKEKRLANVFLNFLNVKKIDVTGVLILYKYLEYSITHNCFKSPKFNLTQNKILEEKIEGFGFSRLITMLMDNQTRERYYLNLSTKISNDFILAPVAMLKGDDSTEQKEKALKEIVRYYGANDISTMILQLFSELFQNFIAHAENDNRSIIVVHGNKRTIEFACADNGVGIISSLKQNIKYSTLSKKDVLKKAIERGVTSKEKTAHLGYGLYYINKVVTLLRGSLFIVTDTNAIQNQYGKLKFINTAQWQGTFISIKIPLTRAITIDDIEPIDKNLNLKINFI